MEENSKNEKSATKDTVEGIFREDVRKLVNENDHYSRKYENFPRLPKIFNLTSKGYKIEEINRGHTLSVLSGYKKRVRNFMKNNLDQVDLDASTDKISQAQASELAKNITK